ncbi:MAG: YciI family protein [Burkholderiales bacterium]|nr:YciI family protein [Burkholderiales bacterium]
MRFMILVKASPSSETGARPDDALASAMQHYHDALARAGVLLDAGGLQPSASGWRVRFHAGGQHVWDGPFGEPRALVAGYTLIQVRNREEAMEWARRFPAPQDAWADGEIEVRPLFEPGRAGPEAQDERRRALRLAPAAASPLKL